MEWSAYHATAAAIITISITITFTHVHYPVPGPSTPPIFPSDQQPRLHNIGSEETLVPLPNDDDTNSCGVSEPVVRVIFAVLVF